MNGRGEAVGTGLAIGLGGAQRCCSPTFLCAYFLAGFSFLVSFDSFELESFESLLADSFGVESFEPESLESLLSDEVSLFPGSLAGFLPA